MAKPFHALLAESLKQAKQLARYNIIRSGDLRRVDRERLLKADALQKIVNGWYMLCRPHTDPGETTMWYASYWDFFQLYLEDRFGEAYCLSAQASMDIHLGKNFLPKQVTVMVKSGGGSLLSLPHGHSLLLYQEENNFPSDIEKKNRLNVLPFEYAFCKVQRNFFSNQTQDTIIALILLESADKILIPLLKHGMVSSAERIVGGLRHIGNDSVADMIHQSMEAAGFTLKEENPFKKEISIPSFPVFKSPYSARIETLWANTREVVAGVFSKEQRKVKDKKTLFKEMEDKYKYDAYHSLSIEGYQVTEELIEKIATGKWRPDENTKDWEQRNAMAAKGYFEAFQAVKSSVGDILTVKDAVVILQKDYPRWYLALFSPSVTAGILSAEQLAGFRQHPVYLRGATHVPPPYTAVRDCIGTLFNCLEKEESGIVKAILIHWLVGFIHPYMDGNGRMARFMMNALLVSQGYPWTIVQVGNRERYLQALERASVDGDITLFAHLILEEMQQIYK
ncbi:MAG: hypothetical protein DHS20C10_02810 [marine bacterium B5-7]|nr:MAG: hypothetical protein DHS20C10_02810 [marine bacterium B5-7]